MLQSTRRNAKEPIAKETVMDTTLTRLQIRLDDMQDQLPSHDFVQACLLEVKRLIEAVEPERQAGLVHGLQPIFDRYGLDVQRLLIGARDAEAGLDAPSRLLN